VNRALQLHWPDLLILLAYLASLVIVGVVHSRRQRSLKDYFLAGRSMRWMPIGLSLMAALNSGMDYIMQPAGMIQFGAVCLVVNLSWFFLYPYVFFVTLPMFRRMKCYSAYGYLEYRFGQSARALTAGIFMLWRLGWMAAALYTPCLAISVASGYEEYVTWMIVVLGVVVTLYTMLGGIRAVIWNDVAQFCIMFGGLAITFAIILWRVEGGAIGILANLAAVGTETHAAAQSASPEGLLGHVKAYFFVPLPVVGYLVACLVSRVTTYTSDQVMVQRFQTSKSIRDARQGFIVTAVGDAVWMTALCFIGVALFTYFERAGWPPPGIREKPDQLFPYFMGQVFPVGLTGLVIAAILAASLSSIDSAINSLSTVAMSDFYNRLFLGRPMEDAGELSEADQRQQVRVSRVITCIIGVLGVALACNVSRLGTVFEIANKLVNGFTGPILGIFLLGMFTRRANERGVFVGGIVGTLASLYGIFWSSPELLNDKLRFMLGLFPTAVAEGGAVLSFIWPSSMGLVATLVVGYAASMLSPAVTDSAREWNWLAIVRRDLEE
jgi:SSS family transporter